MGSTGIVTEVERYAIHDGSGIRSTIFLKGCPLRCWWCCNPETQKFTIEMGYTAEKCRNCSRCQATADACLYSALSQIGEKRTIASLIEEVSRDISFYDATGGGVTISGGEPMSQASFAIELLKGLKSLYIDTAMESCGAGRIQDYYEALPYLNTLFLDIKSMNAEKFQKWTEYPLDGLLDNIAQISASAALAGTNLFFRIPVIPGFNATEKDMRDIALFIAGLPYINSVELLPYHKLGRSKYAVLGREYSLEDLEPPSEEHMEILQQIFLHSGLTVVRF